MARAKYQLEHIFEDRDMGMGQSQATRGLQVLRLGSIYFDPQPY